MYNGDVRLADKLVEAHPVGFRLAVHSQRQAVVAEVGSRLILAPNAGVITGNVAASKGGHAFPLNKVSTSKQLAS